MHPRNGSIVRPLLKCRHLDLRAWLDVRGIHFVEDETNQDVAIPRNRVRAELLPLLASRFNPRIVDALADQADIAREVWDWMALASEELTAALVERSEESEPIQELDVAALTAAPPALRRLVLWTAMNRASGGRPVAFGHVDAALRLMEEHGTDRFIDVPGHRVQRVGARLVLRSRPAGTKGRWRPENPENPENLWL